MRSSCIPRKSDRWNGRWGAANSTEHGDGYRDYIRHLTLVIKLIVLVKSRESPCTAYTQTQVSEQNIESCDLPRTFVVLNRATLR
jgi:hypothetical protein